jgi:hypothetical protein
MLVLALLLPSAGSRFWSGQSTSERLLGLGIVVLILGVRGYFWWRRRQ